MNQIGEVKEIVYSDILETKEQLDYICDFLRMALAHKGKTKDAFLVIIEKVEVKTPEE